jgi:hypothetical protein
MPPEVARIAMFMIALGIAVAAAYPLLVGTTMSVMDSTGTHSIPNLPALVRLVPIIFFGMLLGSLAYWVNKASRS